MQKHFEKVRLLPIYALLITTWGMACFEKFLGPGVPDYFEKMFGQTFLARFPGLAFAFYQIACFECIAAALLIASLLRGEFLAGHSKTLLRWGLWMSLINFAMLGFGMRLVQNYDEAGKLFYYFGAVVAAWIFVELTPERLAAG